MTVPQKLGLSVVTIIITYRKSLYTCMIEFIIILNKQYKKKRMYQLIDVAVKIIIKDGRSYTMLHLVMSRIKCVVCFTDALDKIC